MKHLKLITCVLCLCLIIVINNVETYSLFTASAKSNTVSFILGNLKIEVNDTADNIWKYVPISTEGTNCYKNDLIEGQKLTSNLKIENIRPGDAFERDITITNTGSLRARLKLEKGRLLQKSPFKLSIKMKDKTLDSTVTQDSTNSDIWYIDNIKSKNSIVFTIRLEVPKEIANKDIKEENIRINNSALKLLDITATQWNNNTWSE